MADSNEKEDVLCQRAIKIAVLSRYSRTRIVMKFDQTKRGFPVALVVADVRDILKDIVSTKKVPINCLMQSFRPMMLVCILPEELVDA